MFSLTRLSIKSLLLLITVVIALPATAIIIYSGIKSRNDSLADARRETQKLADRIVSEQQSLTAGAEQLMTALAQLPELRERKAVKVVPILRELQRLNPMYSNIVVADRRGEVWAAANSNVPAFNVSDRRYFKNAMASGKLSSGELIISRAISKPTFNLAYPLKNGRGTPDGVIAVGFKLEQYHQLLDRMQLPAGTSFVLMDHEGTILYRAINPEAFIGKPYTVDEFRKIKEGPESGTSIRLGYTGDIRIISYRKVRLADESSPYMYVTAGIPEKSATGVANRALASNLAILMSFLALAWGGAMLIGKRSIIDRFRLLETASRHLAAGDLQVRVFNLIQGGELGEVGKSFDAMADELARREAERQKTERDRTELVSNLEHSRNLLNETQALSHVGSWQWDILTNKLEWSDEQFRIFGYQPAIDISTFDIFLNSVHPQDKERVLASVRNTLETGAPYAEEYRIVRPDGAERLITARGEVKRDGGDRPVRMIGSILDITERREAEELLYLTQFSVENSAEAVFWIAPDASLFNVNEAACHVLGYTKAELLTMSLFDIDPQFPRDRWSDHWERMRVQKTIFHESCHKAKDGRIFPVEITSSFVQFAGKEYRCAFVRDVSERKKAEEALLRTQFSMDRARDAIFWIRPDGSIFYANEAACRSLGYSRDELLKLKVFDINVHFPPEQWAGHWEKSRALGTYLIESVHTAKDGRSFPVEISIDLVNFAGEEFHCAFTRDITERRHMEETLREREALLRSIIDSIPFDLFAIDKVGRYCMQSPTSLKLWGSVAGKRPEEVISDSATTDRWLENNRLVLEGKTIQGEVVRLINGSPRYFYEIVTPIRTDDGQISGILGINIDQTEQRQAEEERQKLEEQLIQAQKMESIGQLAGGLAHDFNNLLTPIIIYAELLERRLSGDEANLTKAGNIIKAALKAKELVQQLLSFSRKQVLEMHIMDLNQVITEFQGILRHAIRESVAIRFCLAAGKCCIRADRNKLEQIIMNLAINAQDAIAGHGLITVETAQVLLDDDDVHQHPEISPGRYLMFAVSDDGCGMDQETQQRIFEPFFTTKGIGRGTGLGLSTVYGIVRQHGGSIWVSSEPGRGTTFKCYFPFVDETPVAERPDEHKQMPLSGGRRTILLVEDNEMVRNIVNELLKSEEFTVLTAEEPLQALRMAEEHSPDLLITDVVMPGMTGPDLHAKLCERYPELKVLYMSGYTSNIIAHQGVLDEGIHYIQKPFAAHELAKKIETLLQSSPAKK